MIVMNRALPAKVTLSFKSTNRNVTFFPCAGHNIGKKHTSHFFNLEKPKGKKRQNGKDETAVLCVLSAKNNVMSKSSQLFDIEKQLR